MKSIEQVKRFFVQKARPSELMSNEEFQEMLEAYKGEAEHEKAPVLNNRPYADGSEGQRYKEFVSSVASEIATGAHDYVFYGYHIADLLKRFGNDLGAEWHPVDGCFEVFLKSKQLTITKADVELAL